MKHLIKHLLSENMEEILAKSFLNCHLKGVHSIMLSENAKNTIRLFIAEPHHELYLNFPDGLMPAANMSISFHPHRTNLTLHCVKGKIFNWVVQELPQGQQLTNGFAINKWLYHSQITEGSLAFEKTGLCDMRSTDMGYIEEGQSVFLPASHIHTVACNHLAAWLVYEGEADHDYKPVSYSNSDLTQLNTTGLYQKPTEEDILRLLNLAELL